MNNDDLPDNFGWNEYEYDKWPVAVDEPENDEYIPDLSSIIGGNDDLDEAFQELHIWDDDDDHNAVDVGLGDTIYTSGATMRRLSQKFSDTSQGQYMVIHNDELSADERQGDLEVIVYPRFSGVNTVPAQGRGY